MEDQTQLPESHQQDTSKPPQTSLKRPGKLLPILITVALVAAGLGGGYWYGHKTQQATIGTSQSTTTSSSSTAASSNSQDVHFVESVGKGFKLDNSGRFYQFLTKLGVPSSLQAVKVESTIPNQGDAFGIFANGTFGNELARWELGDPSNAEENSGGTSEISLIAITDAWLNVQGTTDYSASSFSYGSPLKTATQKQQFMTQLKSSTTACANDPSKGFKTKDSNLAVCVTYSYGNAMGYEPTVTIMGYGDMQNQPILLMGFISIYDPSTASPDQAAISKLVSDAKNGKIPAQTVQTQKEIVSALKQTTVTVSTY